MYSVLLNGNIALHSATLYEYGNVIQIPQVTYEDNVAGSFSFNMAPTHPEYNSLEEMKSNITIKKDNEEIWSGRVVSLQKDFWNNVKVYCEGELAYFKDSIIRPYEFSGSIEEILHFFVDNHNSMVNEDRQFEVGIITVVDNNDYIVRSSSECSDTYEALKTKLFDSSLGGHIRVRKSNGIRYIDYLAEYDEQNNQRIEFGNNLLDITEYIKAEDIFTALIPYGKITNDGTDEVVDITSVNDGYDYIYDEAAVERYGWIWRTNKWEDVTLPDNLINKAREYLKAGAVSTKTIDVKAIDLNIIDTEVERIKLGDVIRVISPPHGIDTYMEVSKIVLDIESPQNSKITLGKNLDSYASMM